MSRTIRNFPFKEKDFKPEFVLRFKRGLVKLSLFEKGLGFGYELENVWNPKTKKFVKRNLRRKERIKLKKDE